MRAVVDTNVLAYYLLGTQPFVDEVRRFWRTVDEAIAPALWEAEFANVIWMAIRTGALSPREGRRRLGFASRIGIQSVASRRLWHGALVRSVDSGVAVYDTLFVELAARERLPLATFDTKILESFPGIAARPGTLLPKRSRE